MLKNKNPTKNFLFLPSNFPLIINFPMKQQQKEKKNKMWENCENGKEDSSYYNNVFPYSILTVITSNITEQQCNCTKT